MSLNSSFVLNCTDESGDPLSKFEWFKDDINITAAANPQFSITQYTNRISYLTVTGVTSELAGSYKCATNNGIGKSQAIADVFVECKCVMCTYTYMYMYMYMYTVIIMYVYM